MHSYKNLALVALAASAITPALAAPAQESQNHARGELEARIGPMGAGATGFALATLFPHLLSTIGIGGSKRFTQSDFEGLFAERSSEAEDEDDQELGQRDFTPDQWFKALSGLSKRNDQDDLVAALKLFGRALNELD